MKKYLEKLPKEILDLIILCRNVASSENLSAYLVGGFVRDLILGVKNLDLDIVIEGDGIKFAEILSAKLDARLVTHKRFGTATLILESHHKIDISSARSEIYPKPAHLPVVSPGTLNDDLFRRDFTINAMAISITEDDFGRLIDVFGGKSDLSNKMIRFLHDLSFIDDPTRILRAVRFEQRNGFKIEPRTLKYLKSAVRRDLLEVLEPQRLRDDLILILKEIEPIKEIKRLKKLTGFDFIDPGLKVTKSTFNLLHRAKKEMGWFSDCYHNRRHLDSWLVYFMGLIDGLKSRQAKGVCKKFALRLGEEKRILSFKKLDSKFIKSLSKKIKPSKIFDKLEPLSYEVIILLKAKYNNKILHKNINDFLAKFNGMRIHLRGEDLRKLGVLPGPRYQKIFASILKAKLDGLVATRQDELALAKRLIP